MLRRPIETTPETGKVPASAYFGGNAVHQELCIVLVITEPASG